AMCKYPKEIARNYGAGVFAAGLARAYDWLYHDLASEERNIIRTHIVNIVSRMYEGSKPGSQNPRWWAKAYLHHDHWIPVGGYGEAALSLLGEVEGAAKWAAYAKIDFDIVFSWLADDGAWHEGAADWCYAVAPLLWFFGAWESVVDENLHNTPWIKNTARYRLYHWLPDESYVYLNDSFRSGRYSTSGSSSCHLLRRLASVFRDGYAQWLAERDEVFDMKPSPKGVYQAPYEKLSFGGEPKEYPHPDSQHVAWNMLWYDHSIKPEPPAQLSAARRFNNQDVVIMRTGWGKDDAVVSLSCSPLAGQRCAERIRNGEKIVRNYYSHSHADYNSFTLFARGQYFIIPPGYARRSSSFQNVVSVNGADFIANPSLNLKIAGFLNEDNFSYAVGDASEAFQSRLGVSKYRRHLLLLKNGWLIIFDDLGLDEHWRSRRIYSHFSWTVHSDPNTHRFSISGNKAVWKSHKNYNTPLTMYILEPQEFAWERKLMQSVQGKYMMEALRLTKPEWHSQKMRVLSAWSWNDNPGEPRLLKHSDFIAVLCENTMAVGFAITSGIPSDLSHPELKGRELLLFGCNPDHPGSFLLIKDGNVR
ncbi:DUF4962 domain-containing protein, partial [bacterium]|nr:DUF4962 domain-containing protein [bacterium]